MEFYVSSQMNNPSSQSSKGYDSFTANMYVFSGGFWLMLYNSQAAPHKSILHPGVGSHSTSTYIMTFAPYYSTVKPWQETTFIRRPPCY